MVSIDETLWSVHVTNPQGFNTNKTINVKFVVSTADWCTSVGASELPKFLLSFTMAETFLDFVFSASNSFSLFNPAFADIH